MTGLPVILGITGASGAVYGVRLLQVLAEHHVDVHLVVSAWGRRTIQHETGLRLAELSALAVATYPSGDQGACIASGSFRTAGMIIAPCSVKTLGAVANGLADNLVSRAADVTLKERRRLVLLFRETPLNEAHLENMTKVTRMGAIVMPPVPAFYTAPQNIADIVEHTVMRVLDQLGPGFEHDVTSAPRWNGLPGARSARTDEGGRAD